MRSVKDDDGIAVRYDFKAGGEACLCESLFDKGFVERGKRRFYSEGGLGCVLRLYRTEHVQRCLHGAGKQRTFET